MAVARRMAAVASVVGASGGGGVGEREPGRLVGHEPATDVGGEAHGLGLDGPHRLEAPVGALPAGQHRGRRRGVAHHRPLAAERGRRRGWAPRRRCRGGGAREVGEDDGGGRRCRSGRPTARGRPGRPRASGRRRTGAGARRWRGTRPRWPGSAPASCAGAGRGPAGRGAPAGARRTPCASSLVDRRRRALQHEGDGGLERPARVPLGDHPGDPGDVGLVVAPVAAVEPLGPGEAEALLPGPQGGGASARSAPPRRRW